MQDTALLGSLNPLNSSFSGSGLLTGERSPLVDPLQPSDHLLSRSSNTLPLNQTDLIGSDPLQQAGLSNLSVNLGDNIGGSALLQSLSLTATLDPASTLQFSSSFFSDANAIVLGPSGNLYVSDAGNNRIRVFDRNGNALSTFGSVGTGEGQFNLPWSLAVAPSGKIYVADFGNDRIQIFDSNGNFLSTFGSRGNGDGFFLQPTGVAIDSSGKVYVTDANNRIQTFDSNGNFLSSISGLHDGIWQFVNPELIAIDESGNLYVPGNATNNLTIYNKEGEIIRTIGGTAGSENGQFLNPQGVALDSRGNIYVTDSGNNRVQIFDRNGNFLSSFGHFGYGNTEFGQVKGVAVDKTGRVYVADGHNHIQIFDPDAGNTPDQALRVNVASNGKTYQGWIGGTDTDDFYSFSLGARNDFSLSLDGLQADANVQLLDINGNVILSSTNAGTAAESINSTLEAGAYRIHVTSADAIGTPFNLKLSVTPLLEGITTTGSDELNELFLQESSQLINLSEFRRPVSFGGHPRFAGVDGSGFSTVIIDTGINLNHPFFGPDNDGNGIADRIVFQFDYGNHDPDASDTDGHGTNVASIAAGLDPAGRLTGMAPGANIINLKVFPDGADSKTSSGNVEQALQWVVSNAREFNIASVNMSLGSGNFDSLRIFSSISDELRALADLGVIVVTAAGNSYADKPGETDVPGVSNHSAELNTLSVGAVWDTAYPGVAESGADRIASFSQRHATLLDIFAPGAFITGAGLGDTPGTTNFLSSMSGTSQAAPHVAGVALLAQQLAQKELGRKLTPAEFRDLIRNTGVTINDGDDENDNVTNTGLNFQRVDVNALGREILRRAGTLEIPPPTVTLAATDFNASESGDAGTYTITRTGSLVNPLTVNYTTSGTATNGSDYNSLSGSVIIPAGFDRTTISISPIDDAIFEGTENVAITLTANAAYRIGTASSGTVFIADNDVATTSIDLRGAVFDVTPEPLNAGQLFNLNFQVQNTEAGASGGFWANFYLSSDDIIDAGDNLLGRQFISGLAGNSNTGLLSQRLRLPDVWAPTWRTIRDGEYRIGMIVDPDNEIRETNEANNRNRGESLDFDPVRINNTSPVVQVQLPSIFEFRPIHTRGDKEFDGNGPQTRIATNLVSRGSSLSVNISAFFMETEDDWTTFSGTTTRTINISELYPGWQIDSILSPTSETLFYTDDDHALDVFSGRTRLVRSYTVQGDTDSGWFDGDDDPWASIDYNPVQVKLRPI